MSREVSGLISVPKKRWKNKDRFAKNCFGGAWVDESGIRCMPEGPIDSRSLVLVRRYR